MSTRILALTTSLTPENRLVPCFHGWSASMITLYYALVSKASKKDVKETLEIGAAYYISKNAVSTVGRKWEGWNRLNKEFNFVPSTTSRAKKRLEAEGIILETPHRILVKKVGKVNNFSEFIDESTMRALIQYVKNKNGDSLILRLYSAFKIGASRNLKFSIAQLIEICGKIDKQYKGKDNPWRDAVKEAIIWLSAFQLIRLHDDLEMRGGRKRLVYSAEKFVKCSDENFERICLFFNEGEMTAEEASVAESIRKVLEAEDEEN